MSALDAFLSRTEDGSFYVGHATVLARIDGRLILIDPVFERPLFLGSWLFFPRLALSDVLLNMDAVMISHCHEDHYDPEFLRRLAPGTPIYLTKGCTGFDLIENDPTLNTRRVERNAFTPIFDGVQVFAIPSDHNSFDSSFIVKGTDFCVFQGNDNFVSREVMEAAALETGPVDHAYIPYAYVWWYPFCLTSLPEAERKAEGDRLSQGNMNIGMMMAGVLDAKHVVPSAGNLVLCDHANSAVNRGIATPFDYERYARQTGGAEVGDRVRVLVAGDYILEAESGSEVVSTGYTKELYFEKMDEFLSEFNSVNPPLPRTADISDGELQSVRERVARLPSVEDNPILYIRRSDRPREMVRIDVNARSVSRVEDDLGEDRIMLFDFQGTPFELWLKGEVSFETVLNSQRFLVFRRPEVFYKPIWDVIRSHL